MQPKNTFIRGERSRITIFTRIFNRQSGESGVESDETIVELPHVVA